MRKSACRCAAVLFFAVVSIDAEGSDHGNSGPIARSSARAAAELGRCGDCDSSGAQVSPGDAAWARMRSTVPARSAVRITVAGRTSLRGTLRVADDQSLTITVGGLDRRVPRADILQVFAPSGTHRERHKNIGMAIGTVAAGIVMARRCRFESTACNEEAMLYYLPLIATGNILGGWIPKGTRWRQIYGRPAP